MQMSCENALRLPARCVRLGSEEMACANGGAGISVTLPIPGLLPDLLRAHNLTLTVTFSWDGAGLLADFPQYSTVLKKFFPMSINFKFT